METEKVLSSPLHRQFCLDRIPPELVQTCRPLLLRPQHLHGGAQREFPPPSQPDQTLECTSSACENPNRASDCTLAETQPREPDAIVTSETNTTTVAASSSSSGWWFFSSKTTRTATAQFPEMGSSTSTAVATNPTKATTSDPATSSTSTSAPTSHGDTQAQSAPEIQSKGWFSGWWGSSKNIEASPAGSEEKDVVTSDISELGDDGGEVVAEENKGGGRSWGSGRQVPEPKRPAVK